jgi:DMSO/TMAO reductase YedYZ molybdopterin-dependent catalytic subunit
MAIDTGETEKIGTLPGWDGRRHKKAAFLAGAMAGMIMTVIMLFFLLTGATPRSLANLVSDRIAVLAGAGITEFFIQTIGPLGKQMLFLFVLIGQVIVGGLLGLLFTTFTPPTANKTLIWRNSFLLGIGFWLLFVFLGFPLLEQGFLGAYLGNDQIGVLAISFVLFWIFALAFGYGYKLLVPRDPIPADDAAIVNQAQTEDNEPPALSRRKFVAIVSSMFVLVAGAALISKAFGPQLATYRASLGDLRPDGTLAGEITPVGDFYQVSKNAFNPKVDGASWQVKIDGLVNNTLTFNLADLQKLPQKKVYHTLTCISNEVGGPYIGNAEWEGVPLRDLLAQAGIKSGAKTVIFTCADGYKDSIALTKAQEENTIFALKMNGERLTDDHGFPGRMLIPDIYGMKNAKWVTQITLADSEFFGYWQNQGWDNLAVIQSQSAITSPPDNDSVRVGQVTAVKGIAYAGSRDIEKVEVSFDNGKTWVEAKIKPRLDKNAWTLWRLEWTPDRANSYTLKVRAYEAGNKTQTAERQGSFPSGSTGLHTISVRAV